MIYVIDYDYDYLLVQLRLLKMIMRFSNATEKILKRIGKIVFSLINITISI